MAEAFPIPSVPFLPRDDIRKAAAAFLKRYHRSGKIPVPIEEIVEFDLLRDIVPIPGLQGVIEVEDCLSHDLQTIYVDEYVQRRVLNRYRFTLAHEVGHLVLHHDFYKALPRFSTVHEWKRLVNEIPVNDNRRLDIQANEFAGLVLVPSAPLEVEVKKALRSVLAHRDSLQENQPDMDYVWTVVIEEVAHRFGVATEPIRIRLESDGLVQRRLKTS